MSAFCNRVIHVSSLCKSQIGFIQFVVKPIFDVFCELFQADPDPATEPNQPSGPRSPSIAVVCEELMVKNLTMWKVVADHFIQQEQDKEANHTISVSLSLSLSLSNL